MVLAELGGKLRDSLRKLQNSTVGGGGSGSRGSSGGGNSGKGVTAADLQAVLSEISRALIEADVNVKLVLKLRDNVKQKVEHLLMNEEDEDLTSSAAAASASSSLIRQNRNSNQVCKLVQRAVVDELTALMRPPSKVTGSSIKKSATTGGSQYQMQRGKANVILFVGLQGAGKTTTIAKYAHYYQKRGWKCCMVCADTFRAGALDQLKQNATKLRIPFYGSYAEADPVVIASAGVAQFRAASYEVIIVDTSGRHKQEASLLDEMQEIAQAVSPNNTILVMDATQGQAVYDQAAAFDAAVSVGSVIVTKLDGHAKGGGALSAVAATSSPVIFTGTGEHFDDLDPFDAESFVSKLLGFGDLKGLMQAMNSDDKKQDEFMDKVSKGEFTLRDMYNHFEKLLNMGPLNKIAGMIPGMPDYLVPKGGDEESTHRLRKFMVIMDSMNKAELDGKVNFNDKNDLSVESRIRRIAAGSGSHPNEVKMLLQAHRQFESMVHKIGKSGLAGAGGKVNKAQQQQVATMLKKNPSQIQQRLNQMDPRMLQSLGGRDNVMAMMQQMARGGPGGGGGMPNMESMQAMMQQMGGGMMPNMGGGGGGGMDFASMMQQMGGGGGVGGMDFASMMQQMGGGGNRR